jgi:hypothetical protein
MELDWKLTRSGPFPEGIRNSIADLQAALLIREARASQKIPAPAYAATPTTSTTTTTEPITNSNSDTTTPSPSPTSTTTTTSPAPANNPPATCETPERLEQAPDVRDVTPAPARSKAKRTPTTTTTNSNPTITMIEQRDNEERAVRREEEARGAGKQDGTEERETAGREVEIGEQERIQESRDEVRGKLPPPTAHPALEHDTSSGGTHGEPQHEHRVLNGENEVHEQWELEYEPACGNAKVGNGLHEAREGEDHGIRERNDDTTHPAPPTIASTLANPVPYERVRIDWATDTNASIGPVPNPSDFRPTKPRFPLASPEHAPRLFGNRIPPPQPIRTMPKRNVTRPGHNTTPRACSPAADAPGTAPPQVPAKRAPTAVVHAPRDLSGLCSSTPNPWRSLRRRHYSHDSHTPRRFTGRRQYPPKYPANTHIPATTISKPPALAPIWIFETVRHPLGIGPTKPVIRAPARMTMDTPTHTAPSHQAIVKSAPPLPTSHPAATVQCQCGQLVPIPSIQQSLSIPLHHTLSSFISHFFLLPFSFPGQFF